MMSRKSAILRRSAASSSSSFVLSRPVSWPRRICTMACACTSSRPKRSMRATLPSGIDLEFLKMAMTSSMKSSAIMRPSRMWARSCAFLRSNCVRRSTTSLWNLMYSCRISRRVSSFGWPSTMANMMTPNVICICVSEYRWFKTSCGEASRLMSMAMCIPLRSE